MRKSTDLTAPAVSPMIVLIGGIFTLGLLVAALLLAPATAAIALALFGVGVPLVVLVWFRPELGLLVLLFLISSFVRADIVDLRLPIGGGLELRDLVLIGMLGLLILRGLVHGTLKVPWWPVSAPLLVFLGFVLFSTLYALFHENVESNWVFSELRILAFYGLFFTTAWVITNRRQMATVLVGLFVLADLIAGVLVLQQLFGANNPVLAAMSYSNWRSYDLQQTGDVGSFGMVRIMPPGVVLVYFAMLVAFCLMAFNPHNRRMRIILVLQLGLLGFGLLLTYTRALWLAVAFALGLALIALLPTHKAHLIRYLVIGIALLGLLFGLFSIVPMQSIGDSALVTAFVDRVLSIFTPEQTMGSSSLTWRAFENEEGLRSVSENPLAGVGLGNSYRQVTVFQGEAMGLRTERSLRAGEISRLARFLHNSYLYLAVKMGLPALACFLWFCVALMVKTWELYKSLSEGQLKGITLAVLAGFGGLMLWSLLHQHFMQTESTAVVGLMAGLAAGIQSIYRSGPVSRPGHRGRPGLNSL